MTDLISPEEKAEVFAALTDITDTFYKDAIQIVRYTEPFNRMGKGGGSPLDTLDILARVTKDPTKEDDTIDDINGRDDRNEIKISFFKRTLEGLGLMNENTPSLDISKDYFMWEGVKYRPHRWGNGDTDFMGEVAIIEFFCKAEDESV